MNFVDGLPKTLGQNESIWVIVDRLTKLAHFIPNKVDYNSKLLTKIYVKKILRLHGVPIFIISIRGTQFTFKFWYRLHEVLTLCLTSAPLFILSPMSS